MGYTIDSKKYKDEACLASIMCTTSDFIFNKFSNIQKDNTDLTTD
jgi:hypothetical protein